MTTIETLREPSQQSPESLSARKVTNRHTTEGRTTDGKETCNKDVVSERVLKSPHADHDEAGGVVRTTSSAMEQLVERSPAQGDVARQPMKEAPKRTTSDSRRSPQPPICTSPQVIKGVERSRRLMAKILEQEARGCGI